MTVKRNVGGWVAIVGGVGIFLGAAFSAAQFLPQPARKTFSVLNRRNPKGNAPEALLGERLFFETRFAQYFAVRCANDVNQPLREGDPVLKTVVNPRAGVPYPGPFAGKSMNCRSCHFVEEFSRYIAGSQRTYTDYAARSPLPDRGDGRTTTPRNARSLVDALIPGTDVVLLHDDGEFASAEGLVKSTLTGREFGWLPSEHRQAVAHIARVIREDNGADELGKRYGGSYSTLLLGTSDEIAAPFRLPAGFRLDTRTASDEEILERVAQLIGAYLKTLEFERDAKGVHTGSAYDRFLLKNNLPAAPAQGETNAEYSQRLAREVEALQSPKFVQPYERPLRLHPHVFVFGELELKGLKIFLRQGERPEAPARVMTIAMASTHGAVVKSEHTGNCVSCHEAPEFTDFKFHNTGAAQEEYDAVHGEGSFAALKIPSFIERRKQGERFLPATEQHPDAQGWMRTPPSQKNPEAADLGLWNVFANDDFPESQAKLQKLLCAGTGRQTALRLLAVGKKCDAKSCLPKTVALFRTASLRDLGHSAPYLHTGQKATVEDVLRFYMRMSELMREGKLRNGDPELAFITLNGDDVAALAAFLRSLDEDYDN